MNTARADPDPLSALSLRLNSLHCGSHNPSSLSSLSVSLHLLTYQPRQSLRASSTHSTGPTASREIRQDHLTGASGLHTQASMSGRDVAGCSTSPVASLHPSPYQCAGMQRSALPHQPPRSTPHSINAQGCSGVLYLTSRLAPPLIV